MSYENKTFKANKGLKHQIKKLREIKTIIYGFRNNCYLAGNGCLFTLKVKKRINHYLLGKENLNMSTIFVGLILR